MASADLQSTEKDLGVFVDDALKYEGNYKPLNCHRLIS